MRRRRLPLRLRALALARGGGGLPHREEREPGAEDAAAHDDALHEPRAYALEDDGDGGATAEDIAETFGMSNVREDRAELKAWREKVGEAQSKHDVREVQVLEQRGRADRPGVCGVVHQDGRLLRVMTN